MFLDSMMEHVARTGKRPFMLANGRVVDYVDYWTGEHATVWLNLMTQPHLGWQQLQLLHPQLSLLAAVSAMFSCSASVCSGTGTCKADQNAFHLLS
jgi:hypothetical protein